MSGVESWPDAGGTILAFLPAPSAKSCHYCGQPADTRDHIVPKSRKGAKASYNIVPACRTCNEAKADRMPTCPCATCAGAVFRWIRWDRWM